MANSRMAADPYRPPPKIITSGLKRLTSNPRGQMVASFPDHRGSLRVALPEGVEDVFNRLFILRQFGQVRAAKVRRYSFKMAVPPAYLSRNPNPVQMESSHRSTASVSVNI
jgi:hypothetical protein